MRSALRFPWLMALAFGIALAAPAYAAGPPEPKEISPEAKAAVERVQKQAPAAVAVPINAPDVVDPENVWVLDLSTGGRVTIVLRPDAAPNHVARIRTLTRQGFYNGTIFHRVIEGFMAQGGDPQGTGQGGSTLPNLAPEFSDLPHVRGAVSMARAQAKDSANSQFFIILSPSFKLDHQYTVFGRVSDGMDYVDAIALGEPPANPSKIIQASMLADHKPPPPPQTPIPAKPTAAQLGVPSLFPTAPAGTAPPPKQ
jgi:cyclophilin family peptidyl-prolyl cis-trans isomerase